MLQLTSAGIGEGFVIGGSKTVITIYSRKFSTFAIATTDFLTISFSANEGGVIPYQHRNERR